MALESTISAEYVVEMSSLTGVPIKEMVTMYPTLIRQYQLYELLTHTSLVLAVITITLAGLFIVFYLGSKGYSIADKDTLDEDTLSYICQQRSNRSYFILGMLILSVLSIVGIYFALPYLTPDFSMLIRIFNK